MALVPLSANVAAQAARPTGRAHQAQAAPEVASLRRVVTGSVRMPDGSPAAGATVMTGSGGQTVTDARGNFALEVELALDAESVEVTALAEGAAGSLAASARVVPAALAPGASAGQLVLGLSPTCHARWLPTFGPQPGMDNGVHAFAVYDDGGGSALHAGGTFASAGGAVASRIAKWNGSRWSALGSGMTGGQLQVLALTAHDDGSGPALYAGGSFTTAGGVAASSIARWNGSSWSALAAGVSGGALFDVEALAVYDDGSGAALYAGGSFTTAGGVAASNIARWNGSSWSAVGAGTNDIVKALAVYDDGSGPALYVGGLFTTAGGAPASRIARWNGSSWTALGTGVARVNGPPSVKALVVYDDGSGPALHVGGDFLAAGGVSASRIAKWNGSSWSGLGSGVNGTVWALAVHDDGNGPMLDAGGVFTKAGGAPAFRTAKWNGSNWSAVGLGVDGGVAALATCDDGSGAALYAGGLFTTAGGVTVNGIGRWNGSSWSPLGSGLVHDFSDLAVNALAEFDDGSGPALYAGGYFSRAGGVYVFSIAKWNGSSWSPLGSGMGALLLPEVHALVVFDDGSGPALYAGGYFSTAGGVAANNIAKWNGSSWSPLGSGLGSQAEPVYALTVLDDGTGPALFAGGAFAGRVAKWGGSSWTTIGVGLNDAVRVLASWDDGAGTALLVGGDFGGSPAGDSYLAKWGCPAPRVKPRRL